MTFNSLQFLIFLPIVVFVYYIVPHKFRWIVLLIASYYAYMSWNPWLVFLILSTTVVSYLAGLFIPKCKTKGMKKFLLTITIIVCIGTLIFFKYFNFLLNSVIDFLNLFSMHIDSVYLDIILPIGISFYTFQTLSYVIDVYREKFEPEKHFGYYALYVSFFPQLIAGPIERPDKLLPQLKEEHHVNKEDMLAGIQLLAVGFFRKCVIADFCGVFVNNVFSSLSNANTLAILAAGALFMIQIYCDFAGYSEIAAGASRLMGIKLSVNFDKPFAQTSLRQFMRHWHITLLRWFTDYVYIPLGGNRKGKARQILNIMIVYLLCGFWHGANWTYVIWGVTVGIITVIESLIRKPVHSFCDKKGINLDNKAIIYTRRVLLFLLLTVVVLFFRASSVGEIGLIFSRLFTNFGFGKDYFNASAASLGIKYIDLIELGLLLVAMIKLYDLAYDTSFIPDANGVIIQKKTPYWRNTIICLFVVAIAFGWFALLSGDSSSSFIYFQF